MTRVSRTAALLLAFSAFTTAHASSYAPPPEGVSVVLETDEAYVTWAPPAGAPQGVMYRVYGINGSPQLLGTTALTHFAAPGGFETFGVAAVVNNVESEIRRACVKIDLWSSPPAVGPSRCGFNLPIIGDPF